MPDTRRSFLRTSALIAGTALAGARMARSAAAAPLEIPPTAQQPGRPIPATGYGVPSKFENHVARRRTDVFVNRQNWSDWSMTPLQHPRHRDAQRADFRAPPRRHSRHRSGDPQARDPRYGQTALGGLDGRPAALSVGLEVLLH